MVKLPRIPKPIKVIVLGLLCIFFMCLITLHFITWASIENMDKLPLDST